jgi:hypothetical protein
LKWITAEQAEEINALRIGAHHSNPRIKYAFVIQNPEIRAQIKEAISKELMHFETTIFEAYEQAAAWVGLQAYDSVGNLRALRGNGRREKLRKSKGKPGRSAWQTTQKAHAR